MEVFILTVLWSPTEDSDDAGSGVYPADQVEVFANFDHAKQVAEKIGAEHVHEEMFLGAPRVEVKEHPNSRTPWQAEVHGVYGITYISIDRREIQ